MVAIITIAYAIIFGFFACVALYAHRDGSYFVTGMNMAYSIVATLIYVLYIVKYVFNI